MFCGGQICVGAAVIAQSDEGAVDIYAGNRQCVEGAVAAPPAESTPEATPPSGAPAEESGSSTGANQINTDTFAMGDDTSPVNPPADPATAMSRQTAIFNGDAKTVIMNFANGAQGDS